MRADQTVGSGQGGERSLGHTLTGQAYEDLNPMSHDQKLHRKSESALKYVTHS